MAVDRGGLQYTIRVRDQFSRELQRFRDGVAEAKASFTSLQAAAGRRTGATRGVRETTQAVDEQKKALQQLQAEILRQRAVEREAVRLRSAAQRDASREARRRVTEERRLAAERARALREEQRLLQAQVRSRERAARQTAALEAARRRDENRALQDEQRRLRGFVQAQQQRERVAARIAQIQQRDLARARAADPGVEAQRRINRGLREEAVIRSQIAQLRARAQRQILGGDILGGRQTLRTADRLRRQLRDVDSAGNRLLFTFRRLVGVLALFTIAREVVAGFRSLVVEGVAFNDRIESAVISIAGLVSAVADVRDATGQSVDQTQELALATGIAREQVRLLRQDALRTTATFTQLLDTFQVAVAPGFAAGLEVDQIRQLTVAISQAATAIGVPQNQLAEEIRSLLSGTIQARTTRIATALGISNADIRRLRRTGELFDFLQDRFSAFAAAAEQQARSTLSGIRTLVQGAVQELLGKAAQPLFAELLSLGNQLFDRVLTIRDAAGNIRPNPEALEAFRGLFNALAVGVRRAREFGESLGFGGLRDVLDAIGVGLIVALEAALGFARGFLGVFSTVVGVVRSVARELNLTAEDLGKIAGTAASILALFFLWRNTLGAVGINLTNVLGLLGKMPPVMLRWLGILALITAGFKILAEEITGLPLTFGDVGKLLVVTFKSAFDTVVVFARLFAKRTANNLARIIIDPIGRLADQVAGLLGVAANTAAALAAVGIISEETRAGIENSVVALEQLAAQRARQSGVLFSEESLDRDRRRLAEIEQETQAAFDRILQGAGRRVGEGALAGGAVGAQLAAAVQAMQAALSGALPVVSTANQDIARLSEALVKLRDEFTQTGVAFQRALLTGGLEGEAGQIEGIFTQEEVQNVERLRTVRTSLRDVEAEILRIRQLSGEEQATQEGRLRSLLRDQVDLRDALNIAENESLRLSIRRAAIVAAEAAPSIARQNILLQAQADAEARITSVVEARLGARRRAVVEAENALDLARRELEVSQQTLQQQIATIGGRATQALVAGRAQEAAALFTLLDGLQTRLELERAIGEERLRQLEIARQEAALVESGTLEQGLREGFRRLATEDLPTAFEAGLNIARSSVQAFADFASSAIVDAFDPTDDTDIVERFARLLQQIAQLILNQLIQLAIARQILGAATGAPALPGIGGGVPVFNQGGEVPRWKRGMRPTPAHFGPRARAFARGGAPNSKDIVPAWLQPGEGVLTRKGMRNVGGVAFLDAVNEGRFHVPVSPDASATHANAGGMQTSGQVSTDALRRASQGSDGRRAPGADVVLPVVIANERTYDRLQAGGRNARLRFDRENAGTLRGIMQRGR